MCISINAKLYKKKDAKISVLDHAVLLGDGVFEALRVFNGKLLDFNEHYTRLQKSAKQIFLKIAINKKDLKKQVDILIKANKFKNANIRVTITRGIGEGLSVNCKNQSLIIFGKELKNIDYAKGVKAVTFNIERIIPTVKSLNFLPSIVAKNYASTKKAFEAILIDNKGFVREGATSNLFIVKNNKVNCEAREGPMGDTILTPEKNILKGIVRDKIIKLAKINNIKIKETEISKTELLNADEIFITNSIIGVVPIILINSVEKKIGNVTKNLIKLHEDHTK